MGRFGAIYRLQLFPIAIHPLRERKEDIPPLMGKKIRSIKQESLDLLQPYFWPVTASNPSTSSFNFLGRDKTNQFLRKS